jgi:hypothetical protein
MLDSFENLKLEKLYSENVTSIHLNKIIIAVITHDCVFLS